MKCYYHPALDAAGYCPACGRPLCPACLQAAQASGGCAACLAARPAVPARSGLPIATIVAIGCLALVLLLALVGVGGYLYLSKHAPKPPQPPPVVDDGGGTTPDATTPAPGEDAALAFARSRKPGWAAKLTYTNSDWTSVTVAIGPTDGDWRTWLQLAWDASTGGYRLVDEGPIAEEIPDEVGHPPISEGGPPASDTSRPGEEAAKRAALEFAEVPDWVAKVTEHSSDYATATVLVGPPASEWVWKVGIEWDQSLGSYVLQHMSEVEYPG